MKLTPRPRAVFSARVVLIEQKTPTMRVTLFALVLIVSLHLVKHYYY